jgi:hypothetical protein
MTNEPAPTLRELIVDVPTAQLKVMLNFSAKLMRITAEGMEELKEELSRRREGGGDGE